jgi:hypothetical protein
MTETAANICEFAVAKLDVKPGDVVVVKCDEGVDSMPWLQNALSDWSEGQGLNLHFLVVSPTSDLSIVHTMTPEEVEKAGAGNPAHVAWERAIGLRPRKLSDWWRD